MTYYIDIVRLHPRTRQIVTIAVVALLLIVFGATIANAADGIELQEDCTWANPLIDATVPGLNKFGTAARVVAAFVAVALTLAFLVVGFSKRSGPLVKGICIIIGGLSFVGAAGLIIFAAAGTNCTGTPPAATSATTTATTPTTTAQ